MVSANSDVTTVPSPFILALHGKYSRLKQVITLTNHDDFYHKGALETIFWQPKGILLFGLNKLEINQDPKNIFPIEHWKKETTEMMCKFDYRPEFMQKDDISISLQAAF